ncbi:MAG: BlaI/MecI/CopY family transcriptional regulator [Lachnospiraceae bacterium]|nr:BlaI/MecI/CopY family transcriptional regulator [Lachnospiraceae bacterium]
MNFTGISDCELLVMKCLWDAGQPISVHVLITELDKQYSKKYKETTVYTFLSNLKKKSYVDSYKKGASYFYPLVSEEAYVKHYAQVMRSFWGDKALAVLIDSMKNAD